MKAASIVLFAFLSFTSLAFDQFVDTIGQYPTRIVGPYKFDLSKSDKGWKRFSAVFVRPCPSVLGWVVTGTIDGTNRTFVLKNPPQSTYNLYSGLKSQYDALVAQYIQAEKDHRQSRQNSFTSRQLQEDIESTEPQRDIVRENVRQRRLQRASEEHQRDIAANDASYDRAEALHEQITDFDTHGFNLRNNQFRFTVYAVKVRQSIQGMDVYDTGVTYR
jgi:hypothetical protein